MTGILSDIGSWLGNRLAGRTVDRRQLWLHLTLVSAFTFGAGVGSYGFTYWAMQGFWLAALLIAMTALMYQRWRQH